MSEVPAEIGASRQSVDAWVRRYRRAGLGWPSRYCVLARVVERRTGRAICLVFSEALVRYGAPEEVLTDNWQR